MQPRAFSALRALKCPHGLPSQLGHIKIYSMEVSLDGSTVGGRRSPRVQRSAGSEMVKPS